MYKAIRILSGFFRSNKNQDWRQRRRPDGVGANVIGTMKAKSWKGAHMSPTRGSHVETDNHTFGKKQQIMPQTATNGAAFVGAARGLVWGLPRTTCTTYHLLTTELLAKRTDNMRLFGIFGWPFLSIYLVFIVYYWF